VGDGALDLLRVQAKRTSGTSVQPGLEDGLNA
jgi:hypothetical protein